MSLSAVHRTVPFRNHATVSDTRIVQHYRARQRGAAWDGSYAIWVVPPEADGGPYPRQVVEEDAVVMRWGASILDGKTIAYPGLLYRQVRVACTGTRVHTRTPGGPRLDSTR